MPQVSVMVPVSLWQFYTYHSQDSLAVGTVVQVPFGSRLIWGVVMGPSTIPSGKTLKSVARCHPWLHLSSSHLDFISSMSRYLICPDGLILKMVLPSVLAMGDMDLWRSMESSSSHLCAGTIRQWCSRLNISLVALRHQMKSGGWRIDNVRSLTHPLCCMQWKNDLHLTDSQTRAFQEIQNHINSPKTIVLEGVTGSGKTEVILKLCQSFWEKGQQVLILVPEILLSHPWKQRVEHYVDVPTTIWHSKMSPRARQEGFENIALGHSLLTIGTRSAVTLPFARLGAIMVDEEHENAFKQGDGVLYHGRDMAILRGHKENVPVVLASATPSLETRYHGMTGKYKWVSLDARFGNARLPSVECLDMRIHKPKDKGWLSAPLIQRVQTTLDRGEQVLLFLNRRGYASLWMCFRCQYRASCPHCCAWMAVHERPSCLMCHYCGLHQSIPSSCPGCQDEEGIVRMGAGVERIESEARRLFPHAVISVLSSDHMGSAQMMDRTLSQIQKGEINLLIGTQLIAKGYHFPNLTCIGVVDTDFALTDVDFRSHEKLFQLMTQVSGRAGRGDKKGSVWLQTWQPDHPLFKDIVRHDWSNFVQRELSQRQGMSHPPFVRLTLVTVAHRHEWEAQKAAQEWGRVCPAQPRIQVFGPAPAPINPLRDWWRWRFIIKSPLGMDMSCWMRDWLERVPIDLRKGVQLSIDRDPHCFL